MTLDGVRAYSALLGGLICAVPNAYFSLRAFRYRGARATGRIVGDFYVGETVKLSLAAAGFALSFMLVDPLSPAALFAGYLLVYLTGLAVLMRSTFAGKRQPDRRS